MPTRAHVKVFISSPADLLPEREVAERVVARLNSIWSQTVHLTAERWEREPLEASRSFQDHFSAMQSYDLVVGILWKRMGSPLPLERFKREDGSAYPSGTAFELETALTAMDTFGKPRVVLFKKSANISFAEHSLDVEYQQYKALQSWWRSIVEFPTGGNRRAYAQYSDVASFENELEEAIESYLRGKHLISSAVSWNTQLQGSPYPGLVAYDPVYAPVFFGRELAVDLAREEIISDQSKERVPALFIIGPSGAGKSSLARAGLLPRLLHDRGVGVDVWRQIILEPSDNPIESLALRLYGDAGMPELRDGPCRSAADFAKVLGCAPDLAAQNIAWGLSRISAREQMSLGAGRPPTVALLILVDQLEVLLEQADCHNIATFLRVALEEHSAWTIFTLRSDAYTLLQNSTQLLRIRRNGAVYDLPPPGLSEISQVIRGPARAAGLRFDVRSGISLMHVLAEAAQAADALPLLQMTLARLFAERRGDLLTYDSYDKIGGLDGAIAAHAESVFGSLPDEAKATLPNLLQLLVRENRGSGELSVTPAPVGIINRELALRRLVSAFVESRLLVDNDGSIRVAHEALLRRWARAANSPVLNPETLRLKHALEPLLAVWLSTDNPADLLPAGTVLASAEACLANIPGGLPSDLERFVLESAARVKASTRQAIARAHRRTTLSIAAAAFLALLSMGLFLARRSATENLTLALITKASSYLDENRPTRAFVVASAIAQTGTWWPFGLAQASPRMSQAAVELETIKEIAAPASTKPRRSAHFDSPVAALDGDGKRLALGHTNGAIVVCDDIGGAKTIVSPPQAVGLLGVSFVGGELLVGATRNAVVLYDLRDVSERVISGDGGITAFAAHKQSGLVVWGDTSGKVHSFNSRSGEKAVVADREKWVTALAVDAEGRRYASAGEDGWIIVRDSKTGQSLDKFDSKQADIWSMEFSHDGNWLITTSTRGNAEGWPIDGAKVREARALAVKPARRWRVRVSASDGRFAIASWDGVVEIFGPDFRSLGVIDGHDGRVNDVVFTEAGIVTADQTGVVNRWDDARLLPMFEDYRVSDKEIVVAKYSADGSRFIAGGEDGVARVFDVKDDGGLALRCSVALKDWIFGAAFSSDAKRAVVVRVAEEQGPLTDVIVVFDTDECAVDKTYGDVMRRYAHAVVFDRSGTSLFVGGRDGELWKLDRQVDANVLISAIPSPHDSEINEMDIDVSGKYLVSAGENGRVFLWHLDRMPETTELVGPRGRVNTVRFSPDGRFVAAGGQDDRIFVWRIAEDFRLVAELEMEGGTNRLGFDALSQTLAAGSDGLYLAQWSTDGWQKVFDLRKGVGVRSIYGFHPTRRDLAFDGKDGVIRILRRSSALTQESPAGYLDGIDVRFGKYPLLTE